MKTKLTTLMLLIMLFSLTSEFVLSAIPRVSSVGPAASNSVSSLGATLPANVEVTQTQNFATSMNITGNINITSNEVVRFAGLSPFQRARVYLDGNITVQGNGTLVLEYVVLYLVGARKDYARYVRLSDPSPNNHPRLIVMNASLATWSSRGYGGLVDVRDKGEITGREFALYRQVTATTTQKSLLNCSGDCSVNLFYFFGESVRTYDNANVSINMAGGRLRAAQLVLPGQAITFEAYNSSNVSLYGANFTNTVVSGNASMSFVWCRQLTSLPLRVMDNATVSISRGSFLEGLTSTVVKGVSVPGSAVEANCSSRVILDSSELKNKVLTMVAGNAILLKNNATFSAYNATISGVVNAREHSIVSMTSMRKPTSLANTRFELRNFSRVLLDSCLVFIDSGTKVSVYDNAYFSAHDATINHGVIDFFNSSAGDFSYSSLRLSRLSVYDTANVTFAQGCVVEDVLAVKNSASVYFESCRVSVLFGGDVARTFLFNTSVSMAQVKDNSQLVAVNSTIEELLFTAANASGSWSGLVSFFENAGLTLDGVSPNAVLVNTYVNTFDVLLSGYSNVTISNSTIRGAMLQGSSVVTLKNVTFAPESISVMGNAKLYVWSVLRVRTVDYFGNPLSGANTTIYRGLGPSSPMEAFKLSDDNGWASFLLFSGLFNATGQFSVGNFEVLSQFSKVSAGASAYLTAVNEDVTVSLPLPSWSGYILPGVVLVVLVIVLVVAQLLFKRIRKK